MPKLVPIQCPQCNAGLSVAPDDEVVQCTYCGTSCFIRRPNKAPRKLPPPGSSRTAIVDLPASRPLFVRPSRRFGPRPRPSVSGGQKKTPPAAAILVLVATATLAIGLWKFKRMRARASHSGDGSVGWRAGGASKKARAPIAAPNLKAVEPTEIIRQAIVHAKHVDAAAKLIDAHFPEVINGAVDVSGARGAGSKAFVRFEYHRIDKTKPPGEDVIQGNFFITAGFKGFSVWAHHKGHATHLKGSAKEAYPLPVPRCTVKQAWKVAVDSGVPSSAKTMLYWAKYQSYTAAQTTDWSFRVKGHNEYRREIDATSCDLVGKWDASGNRLPTRPRSRAATAPRARRTKPRRRAQPVAPKPAAQPAAPKPAAPKPQPAGDCGCAKTDLMCRMRCSSKR